MKMNIGQIPHPPPGFGPYDLPGGVVGGIEHPFGDTNTGPGHTGGAVGQMGDPALGQMGSPVFLFGDIDQPYCLVD